MKKIAKGIKLVLFSVVLLALGLLVFGFFTIPDDIYVLDENKKTINTIYSVSPISNGSKSLQNEKAISVKVELLGAIPVKQSTLKLKTRKYVVPSGEIFGLRLYTEGVVVVSTDKVDTSSGERYPAEEAGISKGDIIISIDSQEIKDHVQVSQLISKSGGKPLRFVVERDGKRRETVFTPVYSEALQKYLGGLWIRDSAAGIGTLTYYDKENGVYGGLGHPVCDVDTGKILPLAEGDVVGAVISGCTKGRSGEAGELCGSFSGDSFGELFSNSKVGVYGILFSAPKEKNEMPVAVGKEVKTGKAKIISTVDEGGPNYYEIEIERISLDDPDNRNMIIRVTDKALLEKTGGIVQGMSGSPIVQNGMLVGAVTHVFVNEPQRGYAIFAQNMVEFGEKLLEGESEKAA